MSAPLVTGAAGAPRPFRGAEAFAYADRLLSSEIDARIIAMGFAEGWFSGAAGPPAGFSRLAPNARRLVHARLAALGLWGADRPGQLGAAWDQFAACRDLVEARLWFLTEIAPDFSAHFPLFLGDGAALVQHAQLFRLFDYSAALSDASEGQRQTARWLRYTTVLSAYEGPELAQRMALSGGEKVTDIGGNSGQFALALVAAAPGVAVEVFDLPAVCALGRRHVAGRPEAGQITFVAGDFRTDPLPQAEVLSFKSVLHDWPDDAVRLLLAKARSALRPEGRLFILEREAPDFAGETPGFSDLANFAFLPFYRTGAQYEALLLASGLRPMRMERFRLDGPYLLIEAVREA